MRQRVTHHRLQLEALGLVQRNSQQLALQGLELDRLSQLLHLFDGLHVTGDDATRAGVYHSAC